jgi:hypothetical protein
MRAILRGIAGENASALRGLTGQGEPGLWTLLGGSDAAPDSGGRRLAGGAGQRMTNTVERLMAGGGGATPGFGGGLGPGSVERIRNPRDPERFR